VSTPVVARLQILSDVRANTKGTYNNAVPFKLMERARFHAHTLGRLFYVARCGSGAERYIATMMMSPRHLPAGRVTL
jgi:hypothetical protein